MQRTVFTNIRYIPQPNEKETKQQQQISQKVVPESVVSLEEVTVETKQQFFDSPFSVFDCCRGMVVSVAQTEFVVREMDF